jgi:prephenate dehydrogenase
VRVAILGIGLIGGSIGLAARGRAGAEVCGYDPEERVRALALELGAIDVQAPDIAGAVRNADVVFVAVPVGALPDSPIGARRREPGSGGHRCRLDQAGRCRGGRGG